jgi:hypothetical protein
VCFLNMALLTLLLMGLFFLGERSFNSGVGSVCSE